MPVRAELAHRLAQLDHRMFHGMQRELGQLQHRLVGLARGLPDPLVLLGHAAQRVDELAERLPHALHTRIERCVLHVQGLAARLRSPAQLLQDAARHLASQFDRLAYQCRGFLRDHTRQLGRLAGRCPWTSCARAYRGTTADLPIWPPARTVRWRRALRGAEQRLAAASSLLASLSYEGVLARGFALVRDDRGQLVASAMRARGESALEIQFHDGRVPTLVARGAAKQARRSAAAERRGASCDPKDRPSIERLLWVMARLRDPQGGCPWDLEQDFASIAPYTIEEAYEVADAIARGDLEHLKDELGDLLLQVVYHAQMAKEAGLFDFEEVAGAIADKMVRRHPHVFGTAEVDERGRRARPGKRSRPRSGQQSGSGGRRSWDPGRRAARAALVRAAKLQRRAARVGFDWPQATEVLDKLDEEIAEIRAELEQGASAERLSDEIGDLLFAAVNLARHLDVDGETALRQANAKFERRFRDRGGAARAGAASRTLDEMEALRSAARRKRGALRVPRQRTPQGWRPAQACDAAGPARPLHRPGDRRPRCRRSSLRPPSPATKLTSSSIRPTPTGETTARATLRSKRCCARSKAAPPPWCSPRGWLRSRRCSARSGAARRSSCSARSTSARSPG